MRKRRWRRTQSTLRRSAVAVIVSVDGKPYRTRLRERPAVGARMDIGFPVVVTESKVIVGGGVLVKAEDASERRRVWADIPAE
jgi:hypothetical protein